MQRFHVKYSVLLALATAAGLIHGQMAIAQEAPAPDAAAQDQPATLKEVIVTAEKKKESAQQTAIALDVVSADALSRNNVADINDLQSVAPAIEIATIQDATIVTIRGVSSTATSQIGDPAVVVNLDGIALQRPTGMDAAFFDVDRIEVLEGPQGTLYGRNAIGGVVNIVTNRPDDKFGGYAEVSAGNYDEHNEEGALNLPIAKNLAIRVSFESRQHEGYINIAQPATSNATGEYIKGIGSIQNSSTTTADDEDTQGSRVQLLYTPTEALSLLLSATSIHQGGAGPVLNGYPSTTQEPPTNWSIIQNDPQDVPNNYYVDRKNYMGELDYDFGPLKATYLFGYVGLDVNNTYDDDGEDLPYFNYNFDRIESSGDTSHEFRLSSSAIRNFFWQAGVYIYKQNLHTQSHTMLDPYGQEIVLRMFPYDVKTESKAAFTQGSYSFTPKLKFTGGIRYNEDDKIQNGYEYAASSINPPVAEVQANDVPLHPIDESGVVRDSSVTFHADLDYQLVPTSMLYAKVDKGYLSGGFTTISAYGPETLLAYEIGSKNEFLDRTLQANFAAFYYDYTNQQVTTVLASGPNAGSQDIVNAGRSAIKGLESQVTWLVTSHDRIELAVNWLDARYTQFLVASGSKNINLAGNYMIESPKWALQGAVQHSFDLPNQALLTPRIQAQYKTQFYLEDYNLPNDRQVAYSLVDALLTYTAPEGNWSLEGYVRNIANTAILTGADTSLGFGTIIYQFAPPRTYGFQARIDF